MINKNGYVYRAMVISSDIPIGPLHPGGTSSHHGTNDVHPCIDQACEHLWKTRCHPCCLIIHKGCGQNYIMALSENRVHKIPWFIIMFLLKLPFGGYTRFSDAPIWWLLHWHCKSMQELVSCSLSLWNRKKKWQSDVNLMSFSGFTDT